MIAVAVGLTMWLWDKFLNHESKSESHANGIEGKLVQISSDFSAHQAEDRTELKWIKESLMRVERKVDNVQAQIRNVATNSNNRTIEMGGPAE